METIPKWGHSDCLVNVNIVLHKRTRERLLKSKRSVCPHFGSVMLLRFKDEMKVEHILAEPAIIGDFRRNGLVGRSRQHGCAECSVSRRT